MNIVQNAIDAVNHEGEVNLKYSKVRNDLVIQISDNGSGISDEQQKKYLICISPQKKMAMD